MSFSFRPSFLSFFLSPPLSPPRGLVEWEREFATAGGYALCITRGGPGITAVGVAQIFLRKSREVGTLQHGRVFLLRGMHGRQLAGCWLLTLARQLYACCTGQAMLRLALGGQGWSWGLQLWPFAFVAWPPCPGVVCPGELAADGGHGNGEIVLCLQKVLDVL